MRWAYSFLFAWLNYTQFIYFRSRDGLNQSRLEKASTVLTPGDQIVGQNRVEIMQSDDIGAEYALLNLRLGICTSSDPVEITGLLDNCEKIRPKVKDANIALRLDAGMFNGCQVVGDYERAEVLFRRYYEGVKAVVGNLPSAAYVDDYLNDESFISIVGSYKQMRTKNSGRSLPDRPGTP